MEATATVTSKGQVTIPKAIRDLCGISEGDQLVFRTTDYGAAIIRVPDLAELAGWSRFLPRSAACLGKRSDGKSVKPGPRT